MPLSFPLQFLLKARAGFLHVSDVAALAGNRPLHAFALLVRCIQRGLKGTNAIASGSELLMSTAQLM